MNFNKLLKSLFGDKSSRDMKLIQPLVEQVKAVYPEVQKLDNDALRQRTKTLQLQVQNSAQEQKARIEELKATIENTPIDERADIFAQIDKIEKEVLEIYEGALNEVMPEVFAIVKETARRFAENEETVVTATDFDRELAADPKKDFITIDGDKAGKWYTTTYSCLVVLYCIRERLPRWLLVRVRPWWLPCLYS